MKTIEYRITYTGKFVNTNAERDVEEEVVRVQAQDINSGMTKAVHKARLPLGNGWKREIHSVEFWQVV